MSNQEENFPGRTSTEHKLAGKISQL